MIERRHGVEAREDAVGQAAVGPATRARQSLERRHRLEAQPADRAAGKARQARPEVVRPARRGQPANSIERVRLVGMQRDDLARLDADKRVAAHVLAALDRLKQKHRAVLARRQQAEG